MFIRRERSIGEYMRNYPIVSTLVIVYFIIWLIGDLLGLPLGVRLYEFGIGRNANILEGDWWRLFTATFLHANASHFIFNSVSLILFGPALEAICGKWRFLLLYFGAGIIGNIASLIFLPDFTFHLGASGSIYGLFGAYLFIIYKRKHLIDAASQQIVLTITIIGVIMTFLQSNVNISAHIGGAIGGFLLAPLVLKQTRRRPEILNQYEPQFQRPSVEQDVGFDPDRWKRKPYRPKPKNQTNYLFIILIALALLGFLVSIIR